MPSIRAAALSDIGRVRRENEDRPLCDPKRLLFGVADGVGGLPAGGQAAELAINEVTRGFGGSVEADLRELAQRANLAVAGLGNTLSPTLGIGTTLTFGCIRGDSMVIAHVGDSRCYLTRGGEFHRLTEDHSVENEARLRRARGEVVYYHEANRNALTRCIGQPGRVEVDLITRGLAVGDRFLFCTDGVTRMISERDLQALTARHADPVSGVRDIVETAVTRGGLDNATAVLVYVDAL